MYLIQDCETSEYFVEDRGQGVSLFSANDADAHVFQSQSEANQCIKQLGGYQLIAVRNS